MSGTANETAPSNRRQALLIALLTTVLGPPVGWTLLYVVVGTASILHSGEGLRGLDPQGVLGLWAIGSLYAYIVGGLPAILSAIAVARQVLLRGTVSYVTCAVTAALFTALCALAWGLRSTSAGYTEWSSWLTVAAWGALLSAASALIVRWLAGRIGVLPPSNPPSPASPQS